jgi:hypothetical protein
MIVHIGPQEMSHKEDRSLTHRDGSSQGKITECVLQRVKVFGNWAEFIECEHQKFRRESSL